MQRQTVEPYDLPYFPGVRSAYVMLRSLGYRASYAMEIAKAWQFLDTNSGDVAVVALYDEDPSFDDDPDSWSNKRAFQAYQRNIERGKYEVYGIGIAYKELGRWNVWEPDYSTFVWGFTVSSNEELRNAIFDRMLEFEHFVREKWASQSCL